MSDDGLTPEVFVRACRMCRPTKHLHGWGARELGEMVQALLDQRDKLAKQLANADEELSRLRVECFEVSRELRAEVLAGISSIEQATRVRADELLALSRGTER